MVRLGFKQCYEEYILNGTKYTTCRLGDKNKKYLVGHNLAIYTGQRYSPRRIADAIITEVRVLEFGDIRDMDLKGESPDCRTTEGLKCVIYHINKVLIESSDLVTLISWRIR